MGGKQQHVANWWKFLDGLIGRNCNTSVKHMDRIYKGPSSCQVVGSRKVMRFRPINLVSSLVNCGGWAKQYFGHMA